MANYTREGDYGIGWRRQTRKKKEKKERRESIPSVALNRTKGQQPLRGTDASFSWGSNVAETHDDEIKKKKKSPSFYCLSSTSSWILSLSVGSVLLGIDFQGKHQQREIH